MLYSIYTTFMSRNEEVPVYNRIAQQRDLLGMSRQHFVNLLEQGQLPFHRVGAHRRVYFKDLREYTQKRDTERRAGLNRLFKKLRDEKQYDTNYTGEDAQ